MPVLTSSDLQSQKVNTSSPVKTGGDVVDEYRLVGYAFPTRVKGISTAHVAHDGVALPYALVDGVFRFTDESEEEKMQIGLELSEAGFVEVLETKDGKEFKEEVQEERYTYTFRHPDFEDLPGAHSYTILADTYTMNNGIIKTQKLEVRDVLLQRKFILIKQEKE